MQAANGQHDEERQWICPECLTNYTFRRDDSPNLISDCCLQNAISSVLGDDYPDLCAQLYVDIQESKEKVADIYNVIPSQVEFLFGREDTGQDGFCIK